MTGEHDVAERYELAVGEIGREARVAVDDLLKRQLGSLSVAQYVYADPVPWTAVAEGGWDLFGASEDDGGVDATLRDLAEVARAVGRWVPPAPIVISMMAKRWSAAAREVSSPVSIAIATGSGTVVPFGSLEGVGVLSGPVGSGSVVPVNDIALVPDSYAPSVRLAEGGTATQLGPDQAFELAMVWAAEAIGCAERTLDEAVAYVGQREQFGQPVGRFQAVKHHLANALIELQQAESALLLAGADSSRVAAALAISFDSSLRVTEIAVQAHGGMGFTWELGLHVYVRHIVTLRRLALSLVATGGAPA